MWRIFAVLGLGFLTGCLAPSVNGERAVFDPSAASAVAYDTYYYGHALFGDPVFDRDVETFGNALSRAFGPFAGAKSYGYNSSKLTIPDVDAVKGGTAELAAAARNGQDLVVIMLTSHGAPDVLAFQPGRDEEVFSISAEQLERGLSVFNADLQVVILQACFSGSLIDDIAHPNRIILTAAAADRSSFGCEPNSDNTWFIESLNTALGQGRSWSEVFALTKTIVRQKEIDQRLNEKAFSNPQSYVGENMRDVWARPF